LISEVFILEGGKLEFSLVIDSDFPFPPFLMRISEVLISLEEASVAGSMGELDLEEGLEGASYVLVASTMLLLVVGAIALDSSIEA
jgi:hypothetical protein